MEKTFHQIEYHAWMERASTYDRSFAPISTQAIASILDSLEPLAGKRHLDVACGTGHLVAAALQRGATSEGIDFAQVMVAAAQANYPGGHFQVADAQDLPYQDDTFDVVTCAFGLSHMEDPLAAVAEAFRVLKPDGRYAFTLWYGPEDGNEFQAIIQAAITLHATNDFKLPEQWVQLRHADEKTCEGFTNRAGFKTPSYKRLPIVWQNASAHEVLDIINKLSLRTKIIIDHLPADIQEKVLEDILAQVESRRTNGSILLAWPALLTVVQKPILIRGTYGFYESTWYPT